LKIIAVASGKGGTGKSCIAAYTAVALACDEKKVLLAELGKDSRAIDIILGFASNSFFNIRDVAEGTCSLEQAVRASEDYENLNFLPCSYTYMENPVSGAEFEKVFPLIENSYDYVVLDGVDYTNFPVHLIDCVLNVVNPEWLAVSASAVLAENLAGHGAKDVRLVINKVPAQVMPISGMGDFDDIIDYIGSQLIAVIPASPKFNFATNNSDALDEDSIVPKIFHALAARLQGNNVPLLVR